MSLKVETETWFLPAEIAGSPTMTTLDLPVRLLQVDPELYLEEIPKDLFLRQIGHVPSRL